MRIKLSSPSSPQYATLLGRLRNNDPSLTMLVLDGNQIGDAGAQALSSALQVNPTLTTLVLWGDQLGDAGAQALSSALQVNPTLTTLVLWGNQLGDAGAQALSEVLKANRTLTTLDLSESKLGAAGAQALSEVLKVNRILTRLDLSHNQLGDAGAQALSEALQVNRTLTTLNLRGNKIGEAGALAEQAIKKALARNQQLPKPQAAPVQPTPAVAKPVQSPVAPPQAALLLKPATNADAFVPVAPQSPVIAHPAPLPVAAPETLPLPPFTADFTLNPAGLTIDKNHCLGGGGFGKVYKGTYYYDEVAIKLPHALDEAGRSLFHQEARVMANIKSSYVVRFYGVCVASPHDALVMEYPPGGDLYHALNDKDDKGDYRQTLPWTLRYRIGVEVGKGMAYLHRNNIIHCDLKSLNVLLDNDLHAKVTDFGLSKTKRVISTLSSKPKGVGTTRWKAPELFKRGAQNTFASDVYSYGMVLWELGARRIPFDDTEEEVIGTLLLQGEREAMSQDTPEPLQRSITQCWSAPQERPSMAALVSALEKGAHVVRSSSPAVTASPVLAAPTARGVASVTLPPQAPSLSKLASDDLQPPAASPAQKPASVVVPAPPAQAQPFAPRGGMATPFAGFGGHDTKVTSPFFAPPSPADSKAAAKPTPLKPAGKQPPTHPFQPRRP